jgi:hypothetical protein
VKYVVALKKLSQQYGKAAIAARLFLPESSTRAAWLDARWLQGREARLIRDGMRAASELNPDGIGVVDVLQLQVIVVRIRHGHRRVGMPADFSG